MASLKFSLPRIFLRALIGLLAFAINLSAAERVQAFDLPSGPADSALRQFSVQSGLDVVFAPELTNGIRTNPVRGTHPAPDAMKLLLQDTGLAASQDPKTGAFMINRAELPKAQKAEPASDRPANRNADDFA